MKVRCTKLMDSRGRHVQSSSWLVLGRTYHVLAVSIGRDRTWFRLIGEEPTPALFEPEMFDLVSSVLPPTWVITSQGPGLLELSPAAWRESGFWERFFDGEPAAIATFDEERAKIVGADP